MTAPPHVLSQAGTQAVDAHRGGHLPACPSGSLPAGAVHGAAAAGRLEAVPEHAAQHIRGQAEEGGGAEEESEHQAGGRQILAGAHELTLLRLFVASRGINTPPHASNTYTRASHRPDSCQVTVEEPSRNFETQPGEM